MTEINEKQILNRGYLAHIDGADYQFITYRLHDSLPEKVLSDIIEFEPSLKFKVTNKYLDQGLGCCLLKEPKNAEVVIGNWWYFDGSKYDIHAYVVMPNHIHILIRVYSGIKLSDILHSWKSYSAKMIKTDCNKKVWFRDYFDRYIRDDIHFNRVVAYIKNNPVKAGLVKNSDDWPYLFVRGF